MSKELHPICFYINDREEMLNQMFSTMKEDKFRAMLPPILKGMQVEELKKCCLEELLGMSSKRIQSIVAGHELLSSSDSEDLELSASENEESPSVEDSDSDSSASCPPKLRRVSKDARTEDTLQIAISSEEVGDLLENVPTSRRRSAHRPTEPSVKPKKKTKLVRQAVVAPAAGDEATTPAAQPEKTLLEMLELELRARAIRAALTHQEKINLLDNRVVADTGIVIEIKEESEMATNELGSSNTNAQSPKHPANQSSDTIGNQVKNNGATADTMSPRKDSHMEIVCEEISSDEEMFSDADDGEPVVIEPVIESIVISSDSEPEKPEEKQESWKERWMQKKDISSVMKASKLITNVKRKMKRDKTDKIALAQAAQEAQEKTQQVTLAPPPSVIQGTVSEFNLLPPATTSLASVVEQSPVEPPAAQSEYVAERTSAEHSSAKNVSAEQTSIEQSGAEHESAEQTSIEHSGAEHTSAEQTSIEQSGAEHASVEQSGGEHASAEQISAEHSGANRVKIDQQVKEQNLPMQQLTAEPSQDSQQTKQPMEQCINEQSTTNNVAQGTIHETGNAALAQGEVKTPNQSAAIVEEPITTQATVLQLTCLERNERSTDDFRAAVDSSVAVQDVVAVMTLQASAESRPKLSSAKRSIPLTEQSLDKEMVKAEKRKKKSKKSNKIVKSLVKRVPAESCLASTGSREQSNVAAPQLSASETDEVAQYESRKKMKKAKREKKSKFKRPHVKQMQSTVSKVLVDATSPPTTMKISTSQQLRSNRNTVELDVTGPSQD